LLGGGLIKFSELQRCKESPQVLGSLRHIISFIGCGPTNPAMSPSDIIFNGKTREIF